MSRNCSAGYVSQGRKNALEGSESYARLSGRMLELKMATFCRSTLFRRYLCSLPFHNDIVTKSARTECLLQHVKLGNKSYCGLFRAASNDMLRSFMTFSLSSSLKLALSFASLFVALQATPKILLYKRWKFLTLVLLLPS